MADENRRKNYPDLFFKNGKPKKKYMRCKSEEKIRELKRLYGYRIEQCAGLECPYYSIGCPKYGG